MLILSYSITGARLRPHASYVNRRRLAATHRRPLVFGFGICGRNHMTKICKKKQDKCKNISENHTKKKAKIMKNKSRRLQKSWKMTSGRRLGGILGLSRQRECSESALGHHFGHFGNHFGGQFRLKSYLFRHRFLHQISEGIFRGFWWILEVIFITFWLQNRIRIRKGEHMKNLCFT